jgi:mRNA interferase MazF
MTLRHAYRGDVILVTFPFSSAAGTNDRPALVLSTDVYHDDWDEILVVALTARPPKTSRPSDYLLQDWKQAGLTHPSWMRSHLATIHRQLVRCKLGQITLGDWQGVEQSLRAASGL